VFSIENSLRLFNEADALLTPADRWWIAEMRELHVQRAELNRQALLRVTKPMTESEAAQADAAHERRWDRFFKDGPINSEDFEK
jgi:hypothetical protein